MNPGDAGPAGAGGARPPSAPGAWLRSPSAFLLLLGIACVVVYLPVRNAPFVFDDGVNILNNPHLRMTRLDLPSLWRAVVPYENLNLRPLAFLSFALNHLFGGYDPFGYHLFNLAVLLLSIPPAYLIALRLGNAWLPPREAGAAALGATALWALHPLLTNGVSFIVQRMTSLYTLFSLAALLFFLRARRSGRPGPYLLAGVSLLGALASKETALFTPLLAVLALWLLPREAGGAGPRAGWALAGLVAGSQAVMLLAAPYALRVGWVPAKPFSIGERLLTEGRVVLRYLELFLLPLPSRMTLDYAFPLSRSLLAPPATLLAAAFHAAAVAFAVWVSRRRPLLAFGILGFYLLQLPEGTLMPLDLIFEHRAYFPAYFLALALIDLLLWGGGRLGARHPERWALAVAVALGALGGGLGYRRNLVWADPVRLWEDTVAKAPGNVRALTNLGEAYGNRKSWRQAVAPLEEAIRLNPSSFYAHYNLGQVYLDLGEPEKAVGALEGAVRINPYSFQALNNLGKAHLDLGNPQQAVSSLQEAIRVNPRFPGALALLGKAHLELGDAQKASGYLQEAVRIDPNLPEALNNLGSAYGTLGRLEDSAASLRRAIAVRPSYAAAHFNLGITLLKLGRAAEAESVARALQGIDPSLALRLRQQMPGAGG